MIADQDVPKMCWISESPYDDTGEIMRLQFIEDVKEIRKRIDEEQIKKGIGKEEVPKHITAIYNKDIKEHVEKARLFVFCYDKLSKLQVDNTPDRKGKITKESNEITNKLKSRSLRPFERDILNKRMFRLEEQNDYDDYMGLFYETYKKLYDLLIRIEYNPFSRAILTRKLNRVVSQLSDAIDEVIGLFNVSGALDSKKGDSSSRIENLKKKFLE